MKQVVRKEEVDIGRISDNYKEPLQIELNIQDPIVIEYLIRFDESMHEEKVLEALRIGVIAIQSASPTLDTKIVGEKFKEVENNINTHINSFQGNIESKLEEYFKADSGFLPRSLKALFGENGQLTQLLHKQIGPSSEFAKSIDPSNKESVISKIEEIVNANLQEYSDKIIKQFSLDIEDSSLVRLKKSLSEEVKGIQKSNNESFANLCGALGIKVGKELEAEKGTEKGREFETIFYDYVAKKGKEIDDKTENVTGIPDKDTGSKIGDYVITLGDTSGAPGRKIVVEVKKQKYKLKDAIDELKSAKENRKTESGIFVFAKGFSPPEIGDFYFIGNDFFVTVDEELIEKKKPLLFFEAAYKISRLLVITKVRKEEIQELDLTKIQGEIDYLIKDVEQLSELSKKAKTIKKNSEFIIDTLNKLKKDIEPRLTNISNLLKQTP